MADFNILDVTTNKTQAVDGTATRMGRVGVTDQSNDGLVITTTSDNVDITTGPGNDVIIAHGGLNFINPGDGDNLMVGGTGQNDYVLNVGTSFPALLPHDTITNFHVSDQISFTNVPATGFQTNFDNIVTAFGPALEISFRPVGVDNPLFAVDLVGLSTAYFQDDPATTRLSLIGETVKFVR